MKICRRQFVYLAGSAAALAAPVSTAWGQVYPSRPVRIIAGFPPGGSNDTYARLIGQSLSERFGQQFIVENRSGAGGNLGTETAAKAAPDGYTLLLATSGDTWNATLYTNLRFNFIRDIEPVATIARGMGALLVHPSVPVATVPGLINSAKAHPGKMTMASAGIGSAPHMFWELFRNMTAIDMQHVPYRGGGPALSDLLGGQVQAYFPTLVSAIEYIRAGKLRALAVTGATRSIALPDIPTVGEFVPSYEGSLWWGIGAPKNTPVDIIERLNREINAALAEPAMKVRIAELGDTPFASSPAQLAELVAEDTRKWNQVIRAAGIKAE